MLESDNMNLSNKTISNKKPTLNRLLSVKNYN